MVLFILKREKERKGDVIYCNVRDITCMVLLYQVLSSTELSVVICVILMNKSQFPTRPVSLYFDLQKIATEFILRLMLSLFNYKYDLKNLEKSKHGK